MFNDFHRFSKIFIDFHWLSSFFNDCHRFSMIFIDFHKFSMTSIDFQRFSSIFNDIDWFSLIFKDSDRCSLIFIEFHGFSEIFRSCCVHRLRFLLSSFLPLRRTTESWIAQEKTHSEETKTGEHTDLASEPFLDPPKGTQLVNTPPGWWTHQLAGEHNDRPPAQKAPGGQNPDQEAAEGGRIYPRRRQ